MLEVSNKLCSAGFSALFPAIPEQDAIVPRHNKSANTTGNNDFLYSISSDFPSSLFFNDLILKELTPEFRAFVYALRQKRPGNKDWFFIPAGICPFEPRIIAIDTLDDIILSFHFKVLLSTGRELILTADD